jgi:hypothetical protein
MINKEELKINDTELGITTTTSITIFNIMSCISEIYDNFKRLVDVCNYRDKRLKVIEKKTQDLEKTIDNLNTEIFKCKYPDYKAIEEEYRYKNISDFNIQIQTYIIKKILDDVLNNMDVNSFYTIPSLLQVNTKKMNYIDVNIFKENDKYKKLSIDTNICIGETHDLCIKDIEENYIKRTKDFNNKITEESI